MPVAQASSKRGLHAQQGSIRATGTTQDVADLLACVALKHWLQAALLVK